MGKLGRPKSTNGSNWSNKMHSSRTRLTPSKLQDLRDSFVDKMSKEFVEDYKPAKVSSKSVKKSIASYFNVPASNQATVKEEKVQEQVQ